VDLAEACVSLQETPGPDPTASDEAAVAANRGKHARRDPADERPSAPPAPGRGRRALAVDEDVLGADAMLVLLAAESRKPLNGLAGRLDSTGSRVAVMAGGMVIFAALIFVVMAVIGSML
jgi:hypothetical protein